MGLPVRNIRGNRTHHPLARVRRQIAPAGPCLQRILPHQSFDPVKTADEAFGQNIPPATPRPVGPVTAKEACPHPPRECLVVSRALAR
jgi:hypothetical protein